MSGHHGGPPQGYSTQLTYVEKDGGLNSDGYSVTITPQKLRDAVEPLQKKLAGQGMFELTQSLQQAIGAQGSFGHIPNAGDVENAVVQFITSHLETMHKMGISLSDFVARVQAAAQIGNEADPATRAAAARARHLGMI